MAEILKDGPIRKMLRGRGLLKSGLRQEPAVQEVMSRTGISRDDAEKYLKYAGTEPYLYVFYDERGNAIDWDFEATEEAIRWKAEDRFPRRPEFRSFKIFVAVIKPDVIASGVK